MTINFTKKVRKILLRISMIALVIVGFGYLSIEMKTQSTMAFKDKDSINNYTMDVIFDEEKKTLLCNQNLKYINNTNQNLDKIYLHIYPNAFSKEDYAPFEKNEMKKAYPNGFDEGYIDIQNVLSQDKKLEYNIKGDKDDILEVKLSKELKENEVISIDMKYEVKLPNSTGRFGYGDNTINITNWFPIACVYDDRGWNLKSYETIGDPFYSETSDFDVKVMVPKKYKIGTTGEIINQKQDQEKTLYEIKASSVRDFAFVLSEKFDIDKEMYKGTEISTYNLNEEISEEVTEIAKDSIKIFSELFGKYPYSTYSVIASDFFIGGMEYPTLVMIDESLYTEENKFVLEYVIAHETAHQWWYSVIGNDEISEPWIDEALTEYSTVLYFEEKYGKDVSDKLLHHMEIQSQDYDNEDVFKETHQYRNSTEYSLNVYTKGALIFDEIRKDIGDEKFFDTLKQYYETFMYENVNSDKFKKLWEEQGADIEKIIPQYK